MHTYTWKYTMEMVLSGKGHEKRTYKQRSEGSKGLSQVAIWGQWPPGKKTGGS